MLHGSCRLSVKAMAGTRLLVKKEGQLRIMARKVGGCRLLVHGYRQKDTES